MKTSYSVWRYIGLIAAMLILSAALHEVDHTDGATFVDFFTAVFCALVLIRHVVYLMID